jgi:hypothetical protein
MGFWPFNRKKKRSDSIQPSKGQTIPQVSASMVDSGGEKIPQTAVGKSSNNVRSAGRTVAATDRSRLSFAKKKALPPSPTPASIVIDSSPRTSSTAAGQTVQSDIPETSSGRPIMYQQDPRSDSNVSQGHNHRSKQPTLHAKRPDTTSPLPREKSVKRKIESPGREQDFRDRSSPITIPRRPSSYADGLLQRETRTVSTRLRKNPNRHTSEVSLPMPESLADMGLTSHSKSFKVKSFNILSPRPTVRYSKSPRATQSQSEMRPPNPSPHQSLPAERASSSKKRIDDLADGLDAKALRELMERDQRRRERKRKTDQAKLEQRLQQRAEKEKVVESETVNEDPGREKEEAEVAKEGEEEGGIDRPSGLNVASSVVPDEQEIPSTKDPCPDEKPIGPELLAPPTIYPRHSQASLTPSASPVQRAFDHASLSQGSLMAREATPELPDGTGPNHSGSAQGENQLGSWASFFRRGGSRRKRDSADRGRDISGQFSNTSRDSIPKVPPQASSVGPPRTFRRSSTPQRTKSKFREDLPELPLSPPDSRVHSPEVGSEPVISTSSPDQRSGSPDDVKVLVPGSSDMPFDEDSGQDQPRQTRILDAATPPQAGAVSQSLASVDSEASWLSGRPGLRSSVQRPISQSQSSLRRHGPDSDAGEGGDVADDPYFRRLSPEAGEQRRSSPGPAVRRASSTVLTSEDAQNESGVEPQASTLPEKNKARYYPGLARHPIVVRQAAQTRSKEGLLRDYQAAEAGSTVRNDEDDKGPETLEAEDAALEVSSSPIIRAQSINYGGGHARHISAGSAKLLDIRRYSGDSSKRHSLLRGETTSTSTRSHHPLTTEDCNDIGPQ